MKALLLLISFTTLQASEEKCFEKSKFRTVYNKEYQYREMDYCIGHLDHIIFSKKCMNQDAECLALASYKNSHFIKLKSPHASPAHLKCTVLGGKPELTEYLYQDKWIETGLCHFSDGSFITVYN